MIIDYEDKILVQPAVVQGDSLWIDTSNYTHYEKENIVLQYSRYESVNIGVALDDSKQLRKTEEVPSENSGEYVNDEKLTQIS